MLLFLHENVALWKNEKKMKTEDINVLFALRLTLSSSAAGINADRGVRIKF